jgi:Mrp family chromosome partitioning ATPase
LCGGSFGAPRKTTSAAHHDDRPDRAGTIAPHDRRPSFATKAVLVVLGGLPGTGKTTIARQLAAKLQALHLRIDTIEHALRTSGVADVREIGYRVSACARGDLTPGISG